MTDLIRIIRAQEPETPLRDLMHPFDRYDLAMELEDAGHPVKWETILAWETCGEVSETVADLARLVEGV